MATTTYTPGAGAASVPGSAATYIVASVTIGSQSIRPLSILIRQSAGGHNELELTFRHRQVQPEGALMLNGAEKLLGQVAEIELSDGGGLSDDKQQNLFVITDVDFNQHAQNDGEILVRGYAPTVLLDGHGHFETFYKKDLKTIAEQLAKPALSQVKAGMRNDPTISDTLPFVCRYNESVWNFLKRLSNETGQWLYFNGKDLVFGRPEAVQGPKIIYGHNSARIKMNLRTRALTQQLFDYEAGSNTALQKAADADDSHAGGYNDIGFKKSKELFGTVPAVTTANFLPASDHILSSIGKARSAQQVSDMYYVSGESTLHGLRVGMNTDVDLARKGQRENHVGIRITTITHHWNVTGQYHNEFEGITSLAQVPPPLRYTPPVTAPVLAQVIDNNDGQGRVRVQFLGWQQQEGIAETDFIRVLTPDGGGTEAVMQNRGYVFIPEVGDQVMVAFENNSPERPYVQGSVFHGSTGLGGMQNNHLKTIQTRSGHIISFDDANSGTHIIIKDPGGNEIYLDTQGKNITITAPETMTLNCKNMNINVAENMTTSVGQNINSSAGMNINSSAGINIMSAATKDLTMLATNIIGKAEDAVTHAATNQITQSGNSFEAMATEEDMKIYSNKKVVNTSGEKGNLF